MLTKEDNEMLTQTDAGTPMGELFRRFWIPACLSEEISAPDCPQVRVRLLGEDLIAFRDTDGNPGLIFPYCPHRGSPMFLARNEEHGIRCVYHGWKFDVTGKCLDIPNSFEGETYKDKVSIKAYPCWDKGGIIWTYMGPADKEPPKPAYEWLEFKDDQRYVMKYVLHCNYFQGIEGDYDPSHGWFLHNTVDVDAVNPRNRVARANSPRTNFLNRKHFECEDTLYGLRQVSVTAFQDSNEETKNRVSMSHFFMPCFTSAGVSGPNVFASNMRVPIDDENCMFYRLRWAYQPFTPQQVWEDKYGGYTYPELIPGTYETKENKANDYLMDRWYQKTHTSTGIKSGPTQDQAVIEDQWGPITDRTQEHLLTSDQPLMKVRQRLINSARALREGEEPSGPSNPEAYRVHSVNFSVPDTVPISEAVDMVKERSAGPTETGVYR